MSKIFLITAPSGAGKTTLAQAIAKTGDWVECISHTTRQMRSGEVNGKTYYFVSKNKFITMYDNGEMAERVEYDGNLYGISKVEIERVLNTGKNVFIIVENDGYRQIKEQYPEAIGIFIYMSKEHCLANMLLRGDSFEKAMDRSLLYKDEMVNRPQYDYVVKNVHGKQKQTEDLIRAIIRQYSDSYTIHLPLDKPPFQGYPTTQITPLTGGVVSGGVISTTRSKFDEPVGY